MQTNRFAARLSAVVAALFLTFAAASARADYSTLAPLVNNETPAVVRLSCRNVDLNSLVRVVVKVANKTIDATVKDPKMAKQAKASLPLLIAGYMSGINSLCESYKEAGLDDVYFVVTPGSETTMGFFAVPLGTIPEEKVEGLKKGLLSFRSLNLPLPFCFEQRGYLFAPVTHGADGDNEALQERVRRQFDAFRSDPRPDIQEALAEFPDAAVAVVFTGNGKTSKRLAESVSALRESADPRGDAASDDVSGKMLRLGQAARYGAMVFDQSDTSIKLRIRFEPNFDPTPTVDDLRARLLSDIRKDEDPEKGKVRQALLDALMPASAPGRLDWKIDEAYIQENMPLIRETASLLRGGGAEAKPSADSPAPDAAQK